MGQQQVTSTDNNISDEIPPLEEDWENDQFTDADTNIINRHNTHSESERIQKEHTEHLLDLTDNQYYSEEYPSNQLQYSILDPDYYGPLLRSSHTQPCDPAGYYPPPPDPADVQHWHTCRRGKCAFVHGHRLLEKRPNQQKAEKLGKGDRTLNNKFKS